LPFVHFLLFQLCPWHTFDKTTRSINKNPFGKIYHELKVHCIRIISLPCLILDLLSFVHIYSLNIVQGITLKLQEILARYFVCLRAVVKHCSICRSRSMFIFSLWGCPRHVSETKVFRRNFVGRYIYLYFIESKCSLTKT